MQNLIRVQTRNAAFYLVSAGEGERGKKTFKKIAPTQHVYSSSSITNQYDLILSILNEMVQMNWININKRLSLMFVYTS